MSAHLIGALAGVRHDMDAATASGDVAPGLTAFLVVLFLVVATALLMRSMVKQIKKVPPTFDDPDSPEAGSTPEVERP